MIDISELMSDPDFVQPVLLKTQVVTTTDFVAESRIDALEIIAAVQPAQMKNLNKDLIDWTRSYKSVWSATPMEINQFIEYKSADYRIVQLLNHGDNGYYEVVAEETKLPLMVPTP